MWIKKVLIFFLIERWTQPLL